MSARHGRSVQGTIVCIGPGEIAAESDEYQRIIRQSYRVWLTSSDFLLGLATLGIGHAVQSACNQNFLPAQ